MKLKESLTLFHQPVPFLKQESQVRQFRKSTFHRHQNHQQPPNSDSQPKPFHLTIYFRILSIDYQMMMQLYLTNQQLLIRRQSHLLESHPFDIQRTNFIILYPSFLNILSFSFCEVSKSPPTFLGCIIIDINFFKLLHRILLNVGYQPNS